MPAIFTKPMIEKEFERRIYFNFTHQFNSFLIDNVLKDVDQLCVLIVSDRELSPVLLENFIHEKLEKDKNLRCEDGLQHYLTQVNIEDVINNKHDDDIIYLYNINNMKYKKLFDKAFKNLNEQLIYNRINIDDYHQTAYLFEVNLSDLDFKHTEDEYSTLEPVNEFEEK